MNGSHDPRQKRRRLQQASPTAEDIAQSNATLQYMTGRNTAWVHNNSGRDEAGSRDYPPPQPVMKPDIGLATTARSAPTVSTLTSPSGAIMASITPSVRAGVNHTPAKVPRPLPQQEQPFARPIGQWHEQPPTPIAPQPAALMQTWNDPDRHPRPGPMHGMNTTKRMSADVWPHALAQGSLPSPVSSDGINRSPGTLARNGRLTVPPGTVSMSSVSFPAAPTIPARHPPGASHGAAVSHTAVISPRLPSSTPIDTNALQDSHFGSPTAIHSPAQRSGSHRTALPVLLHSPTQHSPGEVYLRGIRTLATHIPATPHHSHTSGAVSTSQQTQPQPTPAMPLTILPYRDHRDVYMERLRQQQLRFPMEDAAKSLESGRLLMLIDALRLADGVCLILHQLFCMASIRPDAIIAPFNQIDQSQYRSLESLLGFNRDADPRFLAFCATFPEPLEQVYAGHPPRTCLDEPNVRRVLELLSRFPKNWDYIRGLSERMSVPPLVEDLVDFLGLRSPVLQAAAFRFNMRSLKGITHTSSIALLEEMRLVNQLSYFNPTTRRSTIERADMYNHFSYLINSLRHWELGPKEAPFQIPKEIEEFFTRKSPIGMQVQPPSRLPLSDSSLSQLSQAWQQQTTPSLTSLSPTTLNIPHAPMTNPRANHPHSSAPFVHQPQPRYPLQLFPLLQETPRPQPTHPEPSRSALHQAHLRSPVLMPEETQAGGRMLYRYITGFGLRPTPLDMSCQSQAVSFLIPDPPVESRPKNVTIGPEKGRPPQLSVSETSHTFRLRCSAMPPNGIATEGEWVVAENFWPEEMYLEFNGNVLEKRRKLQHGRYLPIDLTQFVRGEQDGQNTLKIFMNRIKDTPPKSEYIIAVEIIGFSSHQGILGALKRISTEDSIVAIRKSLTSSPDSAGGDDDEIAVTSSSLTIKLFDPYSASKIFDVPVRGMSCLHRDCFDLETFLAMCKRPSGKDQPTVVDCWRCPLCRGDVRPQTLVVDGFLVEVRKELARRNQLDTRAIVVQSDGSWKPRLEERNGTRSKSVEQRRKAPASMPAKNQKTTAIEVIDLD